MYDSRVRDQVDQLIVQTGWAELRLTQRLAGITDDEYLWEPVDGCWSVRRREEAISSKPQGRGEWAFDKSDDEPSPPPLTTIAWRLMHLVDVLGSYHDHLWGAGEVEYNWLEVQPHAAAGVALWEQHTAAFATALRAEDDDALRREVRIPWWPEAAPRWRVVANVITESVHHGAEIGLLRDLYRRREEWRG